MLGTRAQRVHPTAATDTLAAVLVLIVRESSDILGVAD